MEEHAHPVRPSRVGEEAPQRRGSRSSISALLAAPARAPAELAPERMAEVLAIVLVDLVGALRVADRQMALEGLANVLDRRGRTPGGSETAAMLGAVGQALMRLGA